MSPGHAPTKRFTCTSAQKESIMQNKPNFPRFCTKNGYFQEKQTQSNPIFRVFLLAHPAYSPQSNPICRIGWFFVDFTREIK